MRRIVLIAALIAALMVAVKDGRIAREAGLTGTCTAVSAPVGQETGDWQRCSSGKLEGAPDLTRQGCKQAGTNGSSVYWRCQAQLASGP
jgi:hypothetical protein